MRQSLQTKLTLRIGLLLLAATLAVGGVSAWQGMRSVDDLARRVILPTTRLVSERVDGLLSSVQAEARLASRSAQGPWEGLPEAFLSQVESAPGSLRLSAVSPVTGEGTAAFRIQDGRRFAVQESRSGGAKKSLFLAPFGGRTAVQSESEGWDLNLQADAAGSPDDRGAWTGIREVGFGPGERRRSLTYSLPASGPDGSSLIVMADLPLEEAARLLAGLALPDGGIAFLAEEGDLGVLRNATDGASEAEARELPRLDASEDDLIRDIARQIDQKPLRRTRDAEVQTLFAHRGGARYVVGFRPVTMADGPPLIAFVAIPTESFLGSLKQAVLLVAALSLLGLGGAIVGSSILARRVTRPLYAVMNETSRIRELDLRERALPESGIAEVDELADSVSRMKRSLRSFEKLVPADYARWLMKSGQEARLEGERRELTIFFADVVGFTRLSEEMPPERLVQVLARYFEVLTGAVLEEGGTVDKFNGDDVMAFWGAPQPQSDHAERAVRAALKAQTALAALRPEWEAEGVPIRDVSYGIATGDVIVGNIGNRRRMNYTVIGDAANLASRLEGMNRQYGASILISDSTRRQIGSGFVVRPLERAVIQGRSMPEVIWEVLPGQAGAGLAAASLEAWTLEEEGRWPEAAEAWERALALRPGDLPARMGIDRCRAAAG